MEDDEEDREDEYRISKCGKLDDHTISYVFLFAIIIVLVLGGLTYWAY